MTDPQATYEKLELTADEQSYVDGLKHYFNDVACKEMDTPLTLDVSKRRDLPPQVEDRWHPHDDRPYFHFNVAACDEPSGKVAFVLIQQFLDQGIHFQVEPQVSFTMQRYSVAAMRDAGEKLLQMTPRVVKHVRQNPSL